MGCSLQSLRYKAPFSLTYHVRSLKRLLLFSMCKYYWLNDQINHIRSTKYNIMTQYLLFQMPKTLMVLQKAFSQVPRYHCVHWSLHLDNVDPCQHINGTIDLINCFFFFQIASNCLLCRWPPCNHPLGLHILLIMLKLL